MDGGSLEVMRISVNIRKPVRRVFRETYFFPLMLVILGSGLIYFSQSNFDEEKVNHAIYEVSLIGETLKSSFKKSLKLSSNIYKKEKRPQRRPFSY